MKLENINSADDIERYVEGCINDFETGISNKDETIVNLCELVADIYSRAKQTKTN